MERVERCPHKTITADAWAAVRAYHFVTEYGILPAAGGMADQAASFDHALRLIDAEAAAAAQDASTDTRDHRRKRFEHKVVNATNAKDTVAHGVR
jgi:hypothetical protein